MKRLLTVFTAMLLFFAACGGSLQEVHVKGNEFRFEPATLTLKRGQRVRITLENTGAQVHDLSSDAPARQIVERSAGEHAHSQEQVARLHVVVGPGASGTLTFTPTENGTFPFWCSVSGHREAGMVGTITVE